MTMTPSSDGMNGLPHPDLGSSPTGLGSESLHFPPQICLQLSQSILLFSQNSTLHPFHTQLGLKKKKKPRQDRIYSPGWSQTAYEAKSYFLFVFVLLLLFRQDLSKSPAVLEFTVYARLV